jgi:hypothetical protein
MGWGKRLEIGIERWPRTTFSISISIAMRAPRRSAAEPR